MKGTYILALMGALLFMGPIGPAKASDQENPKAQKTKQIEINLKNLEKMELACIRHVGSYNKSEPAWNELMKWAITSGAIRQDAVFVGLAYDDPKETSEDKLRFDVCITLPSGVSVPGNINVKEAGGAVYLHARHVGPYKNLKDTYSLLEKWYKANNKKFGKGPAIEIYRNDPKSTPPEELITDIYLAIK